MRVNDVENAKRMVGIGERLSIEYDLVLAKITSSASQGLYYDVFTYDKDSIVVDTIKKYLIEANFEVEEDVDEDYRTLEVSWL